eukprot:4219714-Prymnesium_polylepis.1
MMRRVAVADATRALRCRLTYVRDKVDAGKWDTVHGQTLRCEGYSFLPDSMYSGNRHATRTGARCHLSLSSAWHSPHSSMLL